MRQLTSLSTYLKKTRLDLETNDILDITLGIDNRYFIDPVLLKNSKIDEFLDARKLVLDYFSELIKMIKVSHLSSQMKQKTIDRLAVKEPQGLSLGYGGKRDTGCSISITVAENMIKTIIEILQIGIEDPEIVEVLSMFIQGYGPDSISDLTIHIIYEKFCAFTQRKSIELKIKTKKFTINNNKYYLPKNPFKDGPILFVPISLVSKLPLATDREEVKDAAQFNDSLRERVSELYFDSVREAILNMQYSDTETMQRIKKDLATIVEVYKTTEANNYDIKKDELGYYNIPSAVEGESKHILCKHKPKNNIELLSSIKELLGQFKKSIEDNGLNKVLYKDDGSLHREEIVQLLFYSIADIYCNIANIILGRESNGGRGPVDFFLGTGYHSKILIEAKKSNNNNLLSGYEKQLAAYEKSESSYYSFYLVIITKERKKDDQLSYVEELEKANIKLNKKTPELFIIDGIKYPSPSKLK